MIRFLVFGVIFGGGMATYGYFMRFTNPTMGASLTTAGAPIAKKIAPYFLILAVLSAVLLIGSAALRVRF